MTAADRVLEAACAWAAARPDVPVGGNNKVERALMAAVREYADDVMRREMAGQLFEIAG